MITRSGTVIESSSSRPQRLVIQLDDHKRCSACKASSCCQNVWQNHLKPEQTVELINHDQPLFQPHDTIMIGIKEQAALRLSATFFLLPLSAIVLGAALFAWISQGLEWAIVLGGLVGFVLSGVFLRNWSKSAQSKQQYQPQIMNQTPLTAPSSTSVNTNE